MTKTKPTRKQIIEIAAKAGADPRTVERVVKGERVKPPSLARILPALRALGLAVLVFVLGCDAEGVARRADAQDAGPGATRGMTDAEVTGQDSRAVEPDTSPVVVVQSDTGIAQLPDTMPALLPDTMPTVATDVQVQTDTMAVQVAADTMAATGLASLRACPAPRVFSGVSVCSGKWTGDGKSFCIQGGQDADGVIYGQVVKYGESPCTAMGVSDSVSGRVVIVVIPVGACDAYCKP